MLRLVLCRWDGKMLTFSELYAKEWAKEWAVQRMGDDPKLNLTWLTLKQTHNIYHSSSFSADIKYQMMVYLKRLRNLL